MSTGPYLTDVLQVLDVDAFSIHDFLNHIGSHLLFVLGAVCVPGSWIFLVRYAFHTFCTRVLLVHTHLKHIHHKHSDTLTRQFANLKSGLLFRNIFSPIISFFQLKILKLYYKYAA